MLGLAVLFGLGLWIVITCGAIWFGVRLAKKISQKSYAKYIGGLLGFMLIMGGFIIYWTIEYYHIQARVKYFCETEGGLKVFVTPEQYKIRLEKNDWTNLPKYYPTVKGKFKNTYITYKGVDYKLQRRNEDKVQILLNSTDLHPRVPYVKDFGSITYDTQHQVVLSQLIMYSVGGGSIANELSALKFWMNDIDDCYPVLYQNQRYKIKQKYLSLNEEINHEQ